MKILAASPLAEAFTLFFDICNRDCSVRHCLCFHVNVSHLYGGYSEAVKLSYYFTGGAKLAYLAMLALEEAKQIKHLFQRINALFA